MSVNWRVIGVLLLVAAGIAATYNLLTRTGAADTADIGGSAPDYILKDFELVALDDNGQEAFTVKAPALTRNDSDSSFQVTSPSFHIAGGSPWSIGANSAWVNGDNSEIQLKGDVVATTSTPKGPMKLSTQQLNVYPVTKIAKAPVLATINQPGVTISGNDGLEAELQSQRVTFKRMRAHYSGR